MSFRRNLLRNRVFQAAALPQITQFEVALQLQVAVAVFNRSLHSQFSVSKAINEGFPIQVYPQLCQSAGIYYEIEFLKQQIYHKLHSLQSQFAVAVFSRSFQFQKLFMKDFRFKCTPNFVIPQESITKSIFATSSFTTNYTVCSRSFQSQFAFAVCSFKSY